MLLKLGVDISRLSDQIRRILPVVDRAMQPEEAIVTSTYEGTHSSGSLHYVNRAIDLRLPENVPQVLAKLRAELGKDYDVVLETTHLHVEYDPK